MARLAMAFVYGMTCYLVRAAGFRRHFPPISKNKTSWLAFFFQTHFAEGLPI